MGTWTGAQISPLRVRPQGALCRIKAAIEIEIGPSEVQPDLFGHLFERFQALVSKTISVSLTGATGTGAKT